MGTGYRLLIFFFTASYSDIRCQSEFCRKVTGIAKSLKRTLDVSPTKSDSSDCSLMTGRVGLLISVSA